MVIGPDAPDPAEPVASEAGSADGASEVEPVTNEMEQITSKFDSGVFDQCYKIGNDSDDTEMDMV